MIIILFFIVLVYWLEFGKESGLYESRIYGGCIDIKEFFFYGKKKLKVRMVIFFFKNYVIGVKF